VSTVASIPEQKVILKGVSWETYERLLAEHEESSGTRFSYDRGTLEIMVLSARHEAIKHTVSLLVEVLAEELSIDVYGLGSTTFRREDIERGFEPDACFYIEREVDIRGKAEIDLKIDPPPDLVIEIDITSPSLDKFPIFAALGVQEVCRYDGQSISIFRLQNAWYFSETHSAALTGISCTLLNELIEASNQMKRTVWLRLVRERIRTDRSI